MNVETHDLDPLAAIASPLGLVDERLGDEDSEILVDSLATFWPAPLIDLVEAVRDADAGDRVVLTYSDESCESELIAWANRRGHEILGRDDQVDLLTEPARSSRRFVIRVSSAR
jgi:TusA-related sulfurtransferase